MVLTRVEVSTPLGLQVRLSLNTWWPRTSRGGLEHDHARRCVGFCGLTEEEVLAIAEHEHLPQIVATALAQYLLSREHGSEEIRDMIVDDIREAQWNGNKEHVLTLLHVLHHF